MQYLISLNKFVFMASLFFSRFEKESDFRGTRLDIIKESFNFFERLGLPKPNGNSISSYYRNFFDELYADGVIGYDNEKLFKGKPVRMYYIDKNKIYEKYQQTFFFEFVWIVLVYKNPLKLGLIPDWYDEKELNKKMVGDKNGCW